MPIGMLLRSPYVACNIVRPRARADARRLRARDTRSEFGEPVPLDRFVDYGRWFQRAGRARPRRARSSRRIETNGAASTLELEDGELDARAPRRRRRGHRAFAHARPCSTTLPPELVSHAGDHRDLRASPASASPSIGGGQSALESAALLRENGADAEVLVRERDIHWLTAPLAAP